MAIEALYSTFSGKKWKKIGIKKRSGILVPLFSVHSSKSIGIGDFSDLRLLVDLCVKTKNSILQILPVNFSGHNNCPYSAISSFAIDPVYISLSDFYYRGHRFSAGTIRSLQKGYPAGKDYRCNYAVRDVKLNFLREVFEKIIEDISSDTNFSDFMKASDYWLEDFSIYCVLKTINGGVSWYEWEDRFKNRDKVNITEIKNAFGREILFNKWIQYICYHQLCEAREYAFKKGVYLMGDLPVLPSMDSADVWSKRELFNPDLIAGAPPDMYCVYGQRWGMPVLDRKNLKSDGYRYIVEKLRYLDRFFDMIRIDHVVGLFRIWAIPADQPEETQGLNGFFIPEDQSLWKKHGKEILMVMNNSCESLLCAEDLGIIPAVCTETLGELGIPGYEVFRWKKNYETDYSFISADNYRDLAISTLSTHDTSFWIYWWKHEAGTIDKELFDFRCRNIRIDPAQIAFKLFESYGNSDRLRWKKHIDSTKKLIEILSLSEEEARDIVRLYMDTFNEKSSISSLFGIEKEDDLCYLKKAIEFVLKSSSVFCINLLPDLLCINPVIAGQISHLRINKPGTISDDNWSFAFKQTIEQICEDSSLKQIEEMIEDSSRRPTLPRV